MIKNYVNAGIGMHTVRKLEKLLFIFVIGLLFGGLFYAVAYITFDPEVQEEGFRIARTITLLFTVFFYPVSGIVHWIFVKADEEEQAYKHGKYGRFYWKSDIDRIDLISGFLTFLVFGGYSYLYYKWIYPISVLNWVLPIALFVLDYIPEIIWLFALPFRAIKRSRAQRGKE